MGHYHDVQSELRGPYRRLGELIPGVVGAYAGLHRGAMGDGALSARTKELVALAIAITRECDGCIASHARSAARRGATEAEVAEAIGVTILMNGGPGTVWGPRALEAFQEFSATEAARATAAAETAPVAGTETPGTGPRAENAAASPPPWS